MKNQDTQLYQFLVPFTGKQLEHYKSYFHLYIQFIHILYIMVSICLYSNQGSSNTL